MGKKFFGVIILMIYFFLIGCQNMSGGTTDIQLMNTSLEYGTPTNLDDRQLHFVAEIRNTGSADDGAYRVKFRIHHSELSELIGSDEIEEDNLFEQQHLEVPSGAGVVVSYALPLNGGKIDDIKEYMKRKGAITAEVYANDQLIAQQAVTEFVERIAKIYSPKSNAHVQTLEIKEMHDIETWTAAVQQSEKQQGMLVLAHPNYIVQMNQESYYLWIEDRSGYIIDTDDLYQVNKLTNSSFYEVKKLIENYSN